MRLVYLLMLALLLGGCMAPAQQTDLALALGKCPDPPRSCHDAIVSYLAEHEEAVEVAEALNAKATGIVFLAPSGDGVILVRTIGQNVDDFAVTVQGPDGMHLAPKNANGNSGYPELDEMSYFAFSTKEKAKDLVITFQLTSGSETSKATALGNPFA